MEGTIYIKSELDKGTEFLLTFDFEKAVVGEMNMVLPPWNMLVVMMTNYYVRQPRTH